MDQRCVAQPRNADTADASPTTPRRKKREAPAEHEGRVRSFAPRRMEGRTGDRLCNFRSFLSLLLRKENHIEAKIFVIGTAFTKRRASS